MSEALCGVCAAEPKKYKCPTCALPYCSLNCFKLHKTTHPEPAPSSKQPPSEITLPQPPPPAPIPRYLKKKTDFSALATSSKFQDLLKTYPTLLATLQRVYAATIEPDPEDEMRRRRGGFRGRGSRGRGRGRGRGGFDDRDGRWTQKKGDADGMRILKGLRSGEEDGGMKAFVGLVDEMFGKDKEVEGE
ncbi:hypothetical protein HBH56_169960 [Parastagonospora nodorum]|uniref:HIT-type domain-containing protein n=2 Tax=Phaeosphaeria nodorum (strain SN15 / ATCC MYA-4574 / FGSC 10173) TaxID=321614 RepID=A0A7U2HXL2_PHANO|nr:hypothetical protein SNOG_07654 [Parastagonospora nodorum SN15]KAH3908630.1 hypothetical protein HBH56_169960 [Parastagonospora nodorum]EAT85120.1 hypothetical protein SNOG_07654 [Parastagonospora nodorum SN15]KAH3928526.1 hypothetical protein HBH54_138510 [Parastagonospora nodorum]KAH3945323.1 hypothetical protein HBH53_143860 [Parastagonospora nodorum]KAH3984116.1 hypothetical protein HBH52_060360 [Parastagonospora nodorum]